MRKLFWLFLMLAIVDMAIIFAFSSQNGDASSNISKRITNHVIEKSVGYEESEQKAIQQKSRVEITVRKFAHIVLYTMLGICTCLTLKSTDRINNELHIILFAMIICIFYAISDEFHQHFVEGRSAAVTDVLIDTGGSAIGVLSIYTRQVLRKLKSFKFSKKF